MGKIHFHSLKHRSLNNDQTQMMNRIEKNISDSLKHLNND